jgi:hypothetical protein
MVESGVVAFQFEPGKLVVFRMLRLPLFWAKKSKSRQWLATAYKMFGSSAISVGSIHFDGRVSHCLDGDYYPRLARTIVTTKSFAVILARHRRLAQPIGPQK